MTHNKLTVALVHGAFADSSSWNPVIERLGSSRPMLTAAHGDVPCDLVAIANPLRGLSSDATYVRDVLESIEGPIVLVAHSYGGMVITEAAAGLDSVAALVYVGAFAPDTGESAFGLSVRFPGSTLGEALSAYPVSSGGDELAIRPDVFHHQFAADVSEHQTALMAVTQRPVTQAALSEELRTEDPPWRTTPTWFVFGDQDLNIPVALQRFLHDRAGARGALEVPGASHAISVSRPDAVAETILAAVAATALQPSA